MELFVLSLSESLGVALPGPGASAAEWNGFFDRVVKKLLRSGRRSKKGFSHG